MAHAHGMLATGAAATCTADAKPVMRKFAVAQVREGAGFVVRRAIGGGGISQEESDPFLLLDELPPTVFTPNEFRGEPWHTRQGLLSATYVKEGEWEYDFEGNLGDGGRLTAGECKWVNAGRGGVRMAEGCNHRGGPLHVFQVFVNMTDLQKQAPAVVGDIVEVATANCTEEVSAKVIAGACAGVKAFYEPVTPIHFVDFTVRPGGWFEHALPPEFTTAIVYVYKGTFAVGPQAEKACEGETCLLWEFGSSVWFQNVGSQEGWLVLVAGKPLKEPICRSGPIVLTTRAALKQALLDVQNKSQKACAMTKG